MLALSVAVEAEMSAVLSSEAVWFEPLVRVTDRRDPKDDMYLELALAAGAETIVSSDGCSIPGAVCGSYLPQTIFRSSNQRTKRQVKRRWPSEAGVVRMQCQPPALLLGSPRHQYGWRKSLVRSPA